MPPPAPPIPQLRFSAAWNGTPLAGVSRVTGLRRTIDVIAHREGTASGATTTTNLPGDMSFEPVTLERSLTGDPAFAALADAASPPAHGGPIHGTPHRGTLTVSLHDQTGQLVLSCTLHEAWVSSYDVFAELDRDSDEPVVERITFVYESWQLVHTPPT